MLYWVTASGLYRARTCISNAPGAATRRASGPVRSWASADCDSWPSAATALPVAVGSVASASTSTAGRSPRTSEREKPAGMVTTNCARPVASARSASSSLVAAPTKAK